MCQETFVYPEKDCGGECSTKNADRNTTQFSPPAERNEVRPSCCRRDSRFNKLELGSTLVDSCFAVME